MGRKNLKWGVREQATETPKQGKGMPDGFVKKKKEIRVKKWVKFK